jgi:nitroimidazol reductase NimA-like FMN-containing flavoprotein (pyridoxamine 5'-phosphate oxidase superfamily)
VDSNISLEPFREFLEQSRIPLRLACVTGQGWPMVVSLWYLYEQQRLYCATQKTAKIIYHLEHNARCAFELAGDHPPYRGLRGQGEIILRPDLGRTILERLVRRYTAGPETPLGKSLMSRSASEIAIEIQPVRIYSWDYTRRMRGSFEEKPVNSV